MVYPSKRLETTDTTGASHTSTRVDTTERVDATKKVDTTTSVGTTSVGTTGVDTGEQVDAKTIRKPSNIVS